MTTKVKCPKCSHAWTPAPLLRSKKAKRQRDAKYEAKRPSRDRAEYMRARRRAERDGISIDEARRLIAAEAGAA